MGQLRAKRWYSILDTPTFNQHGGAVAPGFGLTMTVPIGFIYYTLDGTDPRLPREAINMAHAKPYTTPIPLTQSTRVRARTFQRSSAIHDVVFAVGPVAENLRISELMYHPAETGNPDDPNTEYRRTHEHRHETINLNLVRFTNGIEFTFAATESPAGTASWSRIAPPSRPGTARVCPSPANTPARWPTTANEWTGRRDRQDDSQFQVR